VTRWSIGEAEDLIAKFAWCVVNSSSRLHPVGSLRPNDFGLFDIHGNAWEWCQERAGSGSADGPASAVFEVVTDAGNRLARSGGFGHGLLAVQSSHDIDVMPTHRGADMGFRPARTVR
jgi:formylglycine-generating enzyme required for sulfatase activity